VLEILAQRAKESVHRQPPAEGSRPEIERRQNDVQRYRYSRAIAMAAGLVKREGIEYEMSRELERARSSMGIETPDAPGTPIYVPYRLLTEEQRQARLERTLSAGIKGQGAELVSAGGTVELIEMLKNDTVLSRAGATVLTGLTAPLTFAKQTGAIGFKWYGAGKTIDLSDMKFLPEELSVKRMGGAQDYDRELLIQSSIDVENMVVRDGTQGVSIGLDFAGFNGTGGPEPLGFWNLPSSSGLNSAAMGGVPTFPKLTAVPALCRRKNGLTRESTWLAAPELAALLQATAKISGVTAGLIWEGSLDEGQMAGYRALTSSQLLQKIGSGTDEYQLAFGPWRFYVIGLFGGLMVTIDPYTQALNNAARVVFNMHGNVINRYPEAFVRCTGAKIA
jgi:HK97 family phage major capsid protein